MAEKCLPNYLEKILEEGNKFKDGDLNISLKFDKLPRQVGNQEEAKPHYMHICEANKNSAKKNNALLESLLNRRKNMLDGLGAKEWKRKTIGSMTLHLSRASAFENAGISFHPIYGFVYLPASGLKGMARAYAETIWLKAQKDQTEAKRNINLIFGNDPGEKKESEQRAGAIVFHDAFPIKWPELILDITNCHHSDYYSAEENDNSKAPGDWEDPVPVNFLAIKGGAEFSFAVSKRSNNVDDKLLALAQDFLEGALTHLGAGAKTNAGYGAFAPPADKQRKQALEKLPKQETFEVTLELVTPAFLAGANQTAEDCDLRPATLRGQLRWWWRTMHAGYLDVKTLRKLEAAIWGSSSQGGAVRITVENKTEKKPEPFNRSSIARQHRLPNPPTKKTTQGLTYHSYGMDERDQRRYYLPESAKWKVEFKTQKSLVVLERDRDKKPIKTVAIDQSFVKKQVEAAIWLLTHFGGMGAKSRKGFGSLRDIEFASAKSIDDCLNLYKETLKALGIEKEIFQEKWADSPSLKLSFDDELVLKETDVWKVLDSVGFAAQRFAQLYKHNLEKKALGLPRNVRPPTKGKFEFKLKDDKGRPRTRYSSPLIYHIAKDPNNGYAVRLIAFPAKHLPNLEFSQSFLEEAMEEISENF